MKIIGSIYQSRLGEMLLLASDRGLAGVYFQGQRYFPISDPGWIWDDAPFADTRRALDAYFAGNLDFAMPSLDPHGTAFQQKVWQALREIPAGQTRSYGEVARGIGAPSAVRAVGAAIGRNPVSVLIPCHRVVGSGGRLTGYAGGLDRKSWLLDHESRRER